MPLFFMLKFGERTHIFITVEIYRVIGSMFFLFIVLSKPISTKAFVPGGLWRFYHAIMLLV